MHSFLESASSMGVDEWVAQYMHEMRSHNRGSWEPSEWRKRLYHQATTFWNHADVRATDFASRVRFLLRRGLELEEIERLVEEVGSRAEQMQWLERYHECLASDTRASDAVVPVESAQGSAASECSAQQHTAGLWRVGATVLACRDPNEGRYYAVPLRAVQPERGCDFLGVCFMCDDGTWSPTVRYLPEGLKGIVADELPRSDSLRLGLDVLFLREECVQGRYLGKAFWEEACIVKLERDAEPEAGEGGSNQETSRDPTVQRVTIQPAKPPTSPRTVPVTEVRMLQHPRTVGPSRGRTPQARAGDTRTSARAGTLQGEDAAAPNGERFFSTPTFPVYGMSLCSSSMPRLNLVALLVHEYDAAIRFFVDVLHFEVAEDVPSMTTDGRMKRWVVVRPPGGGTGFVLARADGAAQVQGVGQQWTGRVGLFLQVDDFEEALVRLRGAGVFIEGSPRAESYGMVVVFRDPFGNRWDLLGPCIHVKAVAAVAHHRKHAPRRRVPSIRGERSTT